MAKQIDSSAQQELLKMDEQEYKEFLADTKDKVSSMITEPVNLTKFCDHIKPLMEEGERYDSLLNNHLKNSEEAVKKQPRLRKKTKKPPQKGMIWHKSFRNEGYWMLPFEEPVPEFFNWFPDPLSSSLPYDINSSKRDPNKNEKLTIYYVLLTIIHDAQSTEAIDNRIYFDLRDNSDRTWAAQMAGAIWLDISDMSSRVLYEVGRKMKSTINEALEKVKADLPVKVDLAKREAAETKQRIKPVKESKSKSLVTESQSARTTALLCAAAQLNQIADNVESWAKKQSARFIDPNGVKPPAVTLAQVEDWVNTYLSKQRLIAVFFNHPHLSYDKNSGLSPFLTTYERKEFHLIIDVFRLYMPAIATSLKELYDEFWEGVAYRIECHKHSKKVRQREQQGDISPSALIGETADDVSVESQPTLFLDGTVARLVRRLRHIAEMVREELATENPTGTEQKIKPVKEPSKEAAQAYILYHGTGKTQAEVAEIMAERLRRSVSQGQVSKWIKEYRVWAEANNIPIPDPKKLTTITMEPDKINMGTRTDGKITGDPRHRAKIDPDGDS